MKLNNLRVSDLNGLKGTDSAQVVSEWANRDLRQPYGFIEERCVDVDHRNLRYSVGRWTGWEGPYWVHEVATGILYRGTLSACKEWIITCSAAHHEPHGHRHIQ